MDELVDAALAGCPRRLMRRVGKAGHIRLWDESFKTPYLQARRSTRAMIIFLPSPFGAISLKRSWPDRAFFELFSFADSSLSAPVSRACGPPRAQARARVEA